MEPEVLALDQTFEVCEGLTELFEDIGCAVTVARRVVLWVDWVHDHEHSLALGSLCIERPTVQLKLIPVNYSKELLCFLYKVFVPSYYSAGEGSAIFGTHILLSLGT